MAASRTVAWTGRAISVLATLVFVVSTFMKLKGGPEVAEGMAHLGLPESLMMPLAILEVSRVVIYLIPATSVLGAILLAGYMGGRDLYASAGGRSVRHPSHSRYLHLVRPLSPGEPPQGSHPLRTQRGN
jgi:hypothetical protein